jgi:hypothetical protein
MQKALATSGKVLEWKKKLLESHTLEAVLSMPNELFFNSDVTVVTCVMIFTVHKKHSPTKKTYFGYYKDDGFIKRKIQGRFDGLGRWEEIKKKWVSSYINREEEAGFSINKIVTANDEWCAESYMETDYSNITESDFEETVLNYVTFLLKNKIEPEQLLRRLAEHYFKESTVSNHTIKINSSNWISFLISDLFEITGTKTTPFLELEEYDKGKYPYVRTKSTNNGVENFYNYYTEEGNVLTVDSAVIGYCSYQPLSFSASDHVEKLIPKNFKLNPYIALFLVKILNCEQYRYNYGLKASQTRLKKSTIKLPATKEGQPDWLFMENFIKSLPYSYAIG